MQVVFSKIAEKTLEENLQFLVQMWTEKEMSVFLTDIENFVKNLKEGLYKQYPKFSKNTYSVLIGKRHVRVFFRVEKNLITILLFFEMRQDYAKIKEFLKQKN